MGSGNIAPYPVHLGIIIPAGETYGFFVGGVSLRYETYASGSSRFSDSRISIETGNNVGYGGPSPTPRNHVRQLNGGIKYTTLNKLNDAAVISIDAPNVFCAGNHDVEVTIGNQGANLLDSVEVHWEINGNPQTPVTYKQRLETIGRNGPNTARIRLGNYNFTTQTNLKVYTAMPNGVRYGYTTNDTLSKVLAPTLFQVFLMESFACYDGEARLELLPKTGYDSTNITWQKSIDAQQWVNIPNSSTISYVDKNIRTQTWYRVNIGGAQGCYSDTISIRPLNLEVLSVYHANRCNPGEVKLSALAAPGMELLWYEKFSDIHPIASGNPFISPSINATDTFYVAALSANGRGEDSIFVPPATPATTGIYEHMFTVYAKTELTINSININCNNPIGDTTAWDIYYRSDDYTKDPTGNTSPLNWRLISSTANVLSNGPSGYTEIANNLSITIPAGDTVSFYISPESGSTHRYSTVSRGVTTVSNSDVSFISGNRGSFFSCTTDGGIPHLNVKYSKGCISPKLPVVAAIYNNSPPTINLGRDTTICKGSSLTLDAGNIGSDFVWNTGDTTQRIQVDTSGTYIVAVSRCNLSSYSSINIKVQSDASVDSVKVYPLGEAYAFVPYGMKDVDHLYWDFGDGNFSNNFFPTHQYS